MVPELSPLWVASTSPIPRLCHCPGLVEGNEEVPTTAETGETVGTPIQQNSHRNNIFKKNRGKKEATESGSFQTFPSHFHHISCNLHGFAWIILRTGNFQILDPQISDNQTLPRVTPLEHPPWFSFFFCHVFPSREFGGFQFVCDFSLAALDLDTVEVIDACVLAFSGVFGRMVGDWDMHLGEMTMLTQSEKNYLRLRNIDEQDKTRGSTFPMIVLFNEFSQRSAFPRVCWSQRQWKTLTMSLNKCIWTMQDIIWMQCVRLHTVDIRIRSSPHQYSWLSIRSKNKQKWSNMSIQSWLWFPIYLYNPF